MIALDGDFEGVVYRWRCGGCGEAHDAATDPRGTTVACDDCTALNSVPAL